MRYKQGFAKYSVYSDIVNPVGYAFYALAHLRFITKILYFKASELLVDEYLLYVVLLNVILIVNTNKSRLDY